MSSGSRDQGSRSKLANCRSGVRLFTEGFDTRDLKEANELLDTLAS